MATYIMLLSWTEQGIQNVKDSPKRLDSAKKVFRAAGAKLKEFYMTMGRYDMVVVAEAPDDDLTRGVLRHCTFSIGNPTKNCRYRT